MESKLNIRSKKAAFCGEMKLIDYIFDEIKSNGKVVTMASNNIIAWYDEITGKEIAKVENIQEYDLEKECIAIKKDNLYGIYSYYGEVLLPIEFEHTHIYYDKVTLKKDEKCGIYSIRKRKMLIPAEFDDANDFYDFFEVVKNKLYGIYSLNGEEIIPPSYTKIYSEDNLKGSIIFIVTDSANKRGVYSLKDKLIIPVKYDRIDICGSALIFATAENKYDLYLRDGTWLMEGQEHYQVLDTRYIVFGDESKTVFQVYTGKEIVSNASDVLGLEQCLLISKDGKKGLYSYSGEVLIPCEYEEILPTSVDGVMELYKYDEMYFYVVNDKKTIKADEIVSDHTTGEILFLINQKWHNYIELK